jgi:hypothetical protein
MTVVHYVKTVSNFVRTGSTIYVGSQPKRQKTQAPKEPQTAEAVEPDQPWELRKAQPWADKEVAPAVLNDEQKAYLEQVGSRQHAVMAHRSRHWCRVPSAVRCRVSALQSAAKLVCS